ncbi:MAG: DUF882 domain-containing protein [Alphaproteobacteria bacterium]
MPGFADVWSRRNVIAAGVAAAGATLWPEAGWCRADARRLKFRHLHTDERLDVVYYAAGRYRPAELLKVDHFMRDWRENQAIRIDHDLLDFLFTVQTRLGAFGECEVLCGYRTPATNEMLWRRSSGVAKRSYHLVGRAIDINLPQARLHHVRAAALDLERGGVGYYPRSHFVHLDTGDVRSWGG